MVQCFRLSSIEATTKKARKKKKKIRQKNALKKRVKTFYVSISFRCVHENIRIFFVLFFAANVDKDDDDYHMFCILTPWTLTYNAYLCNEKHI